MPRYCHTFIKHANKNESVSRNRLFIQRRIAPESNIAAICFKMIVIYKSVYLSMQCMQMVNRIASYHFCKTLDKTIYQ